MTTNKNILNPETYAEPEVEYTETEFSIPSDEVRVGDLRNERTVANAKTGSKWTYLYDNAGKTIEEIKKGDLVTVVRREPTPESATRQYRARVNRGIAEKLAGRGGALRAVQAKVNESLERNGAVDFALLSRLLVVQAELKLLNELAVAAQRADEGEDLVEVQREFAEHLTNRLVRDSRQHSLSNAATPVQDVLWDAERDAVVEFIEKVRWAI